eukprot:SAG31_NODE_526_length_14475_cov_5.135197_3_plen_281_part_00
MRKLLRRARLDRQHLPLPVTTTTAPSAEPSQAPPPTLSLRAPVVRQPCAPCRFLRLRLFCPATPAAFLPSSPPPAPSPPPLFLPPLRPPLPPPAGSSSRRLLFQPPALCPLFSLAVSSASAAASTASLAAAAAVAFFLLAASAASAAASSASLAAASLAAAVAFNLLGCHRLCCALPFLPTILLRLIAPFSCHRHQSSDSAASAPPLSAPALSTFPLAASPLLLPLPPLLRRFCNRFCCSHFPCCRPWLLLRPWLPPLLPLPPLPLPPSASSLVVLLSPA